MIKLTPAQQRVLPYVRDGLTYRAIASRLSCSPRTVKAHVHAIAAQLTPIEGVPACRLVQRWAHTNQGRLVPLALVDPVKTHETAQ